ncbi:MAG: hypothetical protein ABI836_00715 [Gemmatimonadota bacterium]
MESAKTAALGLVIHYFIATTVMAVYYTGSRWPLSAWHTKGIKWGLPLAKGRFIHIFGIGLVTALMTRRGSDLSEP